MNIRLFVFCCFTMLASVSGKAYWQQQVDYKITVKLDDEKHVLSAHEEILYINNSPDTLFEMYFHLWPNAYRGSKTELSKQLLSQGETSLYYVQDEELGGIDSIGFKTGDSPISWNYLDENHELVLLSLNTPLLPGDSLEIKTPFKVTLPNALISRLGHNEQAYQISQWFPKPAVYDAEGWHPYPYLDQGEFYAEYGDFEVVITLPENYLVAATGDLSGPSRDSEYRFLEEKVRETLEYLKKDTFPKAVSLFPASSERFKTLVFKQQNVHDFAWFADKRWKVSHEYVLLPKSRRRVETWSYFLPHHAVTWRNSTKYINNSLLFYSNEIGEYPYEHCTAVDGDLGAGGGMEYPNVTVIGSSENALLLEQTIAHEVGHNWFYGVIGTNERAHAWMDEGVNSFYEKKYLAKYFPQAKFSALGFGNLFSFLFKDDEPALDQYYWYAYMYLASRGRDQPGSLDASEYYGENYGAVVYAKSAVLFNYLEAYLGVVAFQKAMREYYKKWKYKHPNPKDLQKVFELETGKDLAWFFNGLLPSNDKLDYGIKSAKIQADSNRMEVMVKNNSSIAAPIKIDLLRNDSVVHSYWYEGFLGAKSLVIPDVVADQVVIDQLAIMPDVNRENNYYEFHTLFPRLEPFESKFLMSVPKQDKTQVFYVPFLAYNANDQLQLGVFTYNSLLLEKRFRYVIAPSYGYASNRTGGFYKGVYSIYPSDKNWSKINFSLTYKKNGLRSDSLSGYLDKLEPKIELIGNQNKATKHRFSLRYTLAHTYMPGLKTLQNQYFTGAYQLKNKRVIHPFEGKIQMQLINGQQAKAWAEFTQKFTVNSKGSTVDVRWFGGLFFGKNQSDLTHRFRLTAGNGADALLGTNGELVNRGMSDYLFDEVYLARYAAPSNFLSQQITRQDGGFRTGLFLGANNSWMSTLNLTIPSPVKFLSLFVDAGIYPGVNAKISNAYAGGVQLNLIKEVVEIYFPLFFSQNITDNYEAVGLNTFSQKMKFLFNVGQFYELLD